jgi:flagellar hook-length control protein FliK
MMQIVDFVNGQGLTAAAKASKKPAASAGFDMLLQEAGQRQGPQQTTVESQSRGRDESARSNRSDVRRSDQPIRRRENVQASEDVTATAATAAISEATQVAEEAGYVSEEKAVAKVAEVLEVPQEEVVILLEELELEAEDLTDTAAVSKLLQKVVDAESATELLTEPKFPELYKAINEAMAEVVAEGKVVVSVQNGEVVVQKETDAVYNLTFDDLVESSLDEEATVLAENMGSDSGAGSSRQQADTSQAAVQTAEQAVSGEVVVEAKDAAVLSADEAVLHEVQGANPVVSAEAQVSTAQAVKQAAAPQPVNPSNVIEQIMNQVKLVSNGGQFNEIRMTLKPETLGDIVLRVITQNGVVIAQFEAESQRVKEALESSFNQLRESLEEAGIQFSELSVSVRQDSEERLNQFEQARRASQTRADSVEDVSEEVQVTHHDGFIDVTA